jgi:hypothetical protein
LSERLDRWLYYDRSASWRNFSMKLRRPGFFAAFALVLAASTAPAAAQFQSSEPPPCVKEFLNLRAAAEKKAAAIRAAQGKATAQVACKLFTSFSAAEAKMVNYAVAKGTWCGIPPEVVTSLKNAHAKTNEMRTKICKVAAAGPPRPPGPSLSDALTGPVPDSSNIKTGHGTFDTLTGTPLGTK